MRNVFCAVLLGMLSFFAVFFVSRRFLALLAVVLGSRTHFRTGQRKMLGAETGHDCCIPLSVLLLAGTDPQAVLDTLESLQAQSYKLFEIVILTDSMSQAAVHTLTERLQLLPLPQPVRRQLKCSPETVIYESCAEQLSLRLVQLPKANRGDIWNLGINVSRYPYFACLEAGMVLPRDGLEMLMEPFFRFGDTLAAGGNLQSKRHGPISILENMEFDRCAPALQTLLRDNTLLLCAGPTAYRKDAVIAAGGFGSEGSDAALTLALRRCCHSTGRHCRIVYVPETVVSVPESNFLPTVLQKRQHWQRELSHAMKAEKEILLSPCPDRMGVVYALFFIFSLWAPLLSLLGGGSLLLCLCLGLLDKGLLLQLLLLSLLFKLLLTLTVFGAHTGHHPVSPGKLPEFLLLWLLECTLYRLCTTVARVWGLLKR